MNPTLKANVDPSLCGGRYRLLSVLGEGTTASVYRAVETATNLERAIKVLSPAFARHNDARTRFEREAETMAKLHHPNIVSVFDYGLDGERFYIVMEQVRGGTLMERVEAHGPLPLRQAASVLQQTLLALHYAHTQGVIHRDIKPHNILLSRSGSPKVTDFGLARAIHFDKDITIPGVVMGTWSYMAPEQRFDSGNVDTRTDVFAAGATLYKVLTGDDPSVLLRTDLPDDPLEELPEPLAEVIRRACRYRPDQRYQTAAEMARELADAHDALPSQTPEDEATILFTKGDAPIPVAFKEFGFLEDVRQEMSGPSRARRRRHVVLPPTGEGSPSPPPGVAKPSPLPGVAKPFHPPRAPSAPARASAGGSDALEVDLAAPTKPPPQPRSGRLIPIWLAVVLVLAAVLVTGAVSVVITQLVLSGALSR